MARSAAAIYAMVLLLVLGLSATPSHARVRPDDLLQMLVRGAFGGDVEKKCNICACPPPYYPTSFCLCMDVFRDSCPSECDRCECLLGECVCRMMKFKYCGTDTGATEESVPAQLGSGRIMNIAA